MAASLTLGGTRDRADRQETPKTASISCMAPRLRRKYLCASSGASKSAGHGRGGAHAVLERARRGGRGGVAACAIRGDFRRSAGRRRLSFAFLGAERTASAG